MNDIAKRLNTYIEAHPFNSGSIFIFLLSGRRVHCIFDDGGRIGILR